MYYYTIYKITNQITGKFYIGSHKTKDLNDDYMGSGKYLKLAQQKYGIENFTKKILYVFDNPTEMYAKEAEIVNEDFLATENTYNLKVGGFGGFDYINSNPEMFLTEDRLKNLMSQSERQKRWMEKYNNDLSFSLLVRSNLKKGRDIQRTKYPQGTFGGKRHSDETKKLLSEKAKINSKGDRNSQFGTMWITNGLVNKKIKKEENIPTGWKSGRILK